MTFLLAFSMVGMAFSGGVAAEATADGDIEGDGADVIENFEADGEESETVIYETDANSDDLDDFENLTLLVEYDGHAVAEYDDFDAEISGDDDEETPLELEWEIAHDDLEKLPGDAGETTTTDVSVTEMEDAEDAEEVIDEFEVDVEFSNERAVVSAFSADDSVATFDESDGLLSYFSNDVATIEDDVGIDGENTDVHVYADDSDMIDAYDDVAEDAEDGDRLGAMMTSTTDDSVVYVFNNEAGETITGDEVDADEDTYAVYEGNGEVVFNLGEDDYEGEEEVSVSAVGGETFDRGDLRDDLDYSFAQSFGLTFDHAFSLDWVPGLGFISGSALAGAFVASRRRVAA